MGHPPVEEGTEVSVLVGAVSAGGEGAALGVGLDWPDPILTGEK